LNQPQPDHRPAKLNMNRATTAFGFFSAFLLLAVSDAPAQNRPATASPGKPATSIEDILGDPVIAKGKGFEIKRSRLDEAMANYHALVVDRGGYPSRIPTAEIEVNLLDYLIQSAVLNQRATDDQKARGRKEGDEFFDLQKKKFGSEDGFLRRMRAVGSTPELFHQRLIEDSICNTVLHDRFHVPDAELKKYYDEHPSEFFEPDKARVLYLNLTTVDLALNRPLPEEQRNVKRQKIEMILKRARSGEDFRKLVTENTGSAAPQDDGGEIELVRGSHRVPPEFEGAVFTMQTNQISEVIISSVGFSIVKLLERTTGKKSELSESSATLRKWMEDREITKAKAKLIEDMKKENEVVVLDPEIKRVQAALQLRLPSFSTEKGTNPQVQPLK
jgi:peptidyl-prolyl cis-trans isomerase SurA